MFPLESLEAAQAAALGLPRRCFSLAGEVPPAPRVAVVGSRAALRPLLALVHAIVAGMADVGASLVSGGARGVDAQAHRTALAVGLPQIAVLPCGPDRPYPPENQELFAAMVTAPQTGVLFAQPPGTIPSRGMFASRNALVLGLCRAAIVVQAEARSGTMGTGRLALRQGLPLAVLPDSRGAATLLAAGAHGLPGRERGRRAVQDGVARWLDAVLHGGAPPAAGPDAWPPHLLWIRDPLQAAGPGGLGADDLARHGDPADGTPHPGTDPLAALVALTEAEARGLVVECAPGRYVAVSR